MQIYLGFELEFYLNQTLLEADFLTIQKQCLPVVFKPERGHNQFELALPKFLYNNTPNSAARFKKSITHCFKIIESILGANCINLNPKPFEDDYGSALQISISVEGFLRSDYINFINCLLAKTPEFVDICNAKSGNKRLVSNKFMAPTHLSWGAKENRTTLIRAIGLQSDVYDPSKVRVEYRLANSDADAKILIDFIIRVIKQSLAYKHPINPITWGNSFDSVYNLKKIIE